MKRRSSPQAQATSHTAPSTRELDLLNETDLKTLMRPLKSECSTHISAEQVKACVAAALACPQLKTAQVVALHRPFGAGLGSGRMAWWGAAGAFAAAACLLVALNVQPPSGIRTPTLDQRPDPMIFDFVVWDAMGGMEI